MITADTLRSDHLSINGYRRKTSPQLDAFAARADHFNRAISVIPKTGPAFTTLFTGRHPREHGVVYNAIGVPYDLPVLAELLRDAGYRTAAFVSNPVLRPAMGYARGFDEFHEFSRTGGVLAINASLRRWLGEQTKKSEPGKGGVWEGPRFVWIHYIDPHGPYSPPSEWSAPFLADPWAQAPERIPLEPAPGSPTFGPNKILGAIPEYQRLGAEDRLAIYVAHYDGEIRFIDAAFGEILELLKTRELYDGSAVVFTSDHGESLGEHDYYLEHGWYADDASLRVPLFIKWPGQVEGSKRSHLVSHLDLLPTLLALAGVPLPKGDLLGTDLRTDLGPRPAVPIENSANFPEKYSGLRSTDWKYLIRENDGREELYDLVDDPHEAHNLVERPTPRSAAKLAELRAARRVRFAGFGSHELTRPEREQPDSARARELEVNTRKALEALGYIGE